MAEDRQSSARRRSSGTGRRRSRASSVFAHFSPNTPVAGTMNEASNALQASQRELHTGLMEYDALFEILSDLNPAVMHDLAARYGIASTDNVFHPHIKAFFRLVFPCVAINKQRDVPLVSLARAPTYPRPRRVSESSNTSPFNNRFTPAEALHQALTQLCPIVIKEQRFLASFFRLRKGHGADTNAKFVSGMIEQIVRGQWAKMLQKLMAMVEEKDVAQSAELLCMLRVVGKCLEDLDNFATRKSDHVEAALSFGAEATVEGADKDITASSLGEASPHPDNPADTSSWLSSTLISLQVALTRRWQAFLHEQEAWVSSTIAGADMKQAGVLTPFSRFVTLVEILDDALGQDQAAQVDARTAAYHTLAQCLFVALEKAAKANEKYRDVVRLENYFYFAEACTSRKIVGLETFVGKARERYEEQLHRYLDWHFRKQFSELVEFFKNIDDLAATRGVREVQIHLDRTKLQQVQQAHSERVMKDGLKAVQKRMDKHLCKETNLLPTVWEEFIGYVVAEWNSFSARALECYEARLEPTAKHIEKLAKTVASGAEGAAPRLMAEM